MTKCDFYITDVFLCGFNSSAKAVVMDQYICTHANLNSLLQPALIISMNKQAQAMYSSGNSRLIILTGSIISVFQLSTVYASFIKAVLAAVA